MLLDMAFSSSLNMDMGIDCKLLNTILSDEYIKIEGIHHIMEVRWIFYNEKCTTATCG